MESATALLSPVLALALLSRGPVPAHQEAPIDPPRGTPFRVRTFDSRDGLPQSTLVDVLQASDGRLWAATFGGLCRFDGYGWEVFDAASQPFHDYRIASLHPGRDGSVWIGTERGEIATWHPEVFERVTRLPGIDARILLEQPDGSMLCSTAADTFVVSRDGQARPLYPEPLPGLITAVAPEDGAPIAGGPGGVFRLDREGPAILDDRRCTALFVGPDGRWLVGTSDGLLRMEGAVLTRVPGFPRDVDRAPDVRAITATVDGSLWVATADRLLRLASPDDEPTLVLDLDAVPSAMAPDSSGGLWIGFEGRGLARLRPSDFDLLETSDLAGPPHAILPEGDGWLVATPEGLWLSRPEGGFLFRGGPRSGPVGGLLRDADGALWIGLAGAVAEWRPGPWITHDAVDGPGCGLVRAMARDAEGRLWCGTDRGPYVLVDGELRPAPLPAPLQGGVVRLLQRIGDDLWLAGMDGVGRIARDGASTRWRHGLELPPGEVRAILPGSGGRLWLATYGSGFLCLDPTGEQPLREVGRKQGLLDPFLCTVTTLGDQWLVGGNVGPYLVDPAALDAIADGRASSIACRALVPPHEVAPEANGGQQPSSASGEGRAALCTLDGVIVTASPFPPAPAIPPLLAHVMRSEEQDVSFPGGETVVDARGNRTFVVELASACFEVPPPVRYRWRLPPVQPDWVVAGDDRTLAFQLPGPGEYRLDAQALPFGSPGEPSTASVRFHIAPLPWERPVVRLAAAVLLGAAGLLAFRLGRRRAAAREQRLETLVGERTRALRQVQDQLEQRVAERTRELERAFERIEQDHARTAQLEHEVQKLQRLESLGHLAGGIAHDFNNLLTVILGHAALLEEGGGDEPGLLAARIREAGERGRSMTQHLLAVASQQVMNLGVIDVAEVVRAQAGALADLLGPTIELQMEVQEQAAFAQADAGQIEQLLLNLSENAREAMPEGGRLTIRLRAIDGLIELVVEDSGVGMTPGVRERAFEPFFTTKARQRGRGLGLATVFGIVRQLGGLIEIESEPGRGARFTLLLPRADPVEGPDTLIPSSKPVPGHLRVLLIEDDEPVRHVLGRLLELGGCVVVAEAARGEEALRWLEADGTRVDVVLSDLQMPGIQGIDLVHALRQRRPGLPIVFLSGFATEHSHEDFRAYDIELLPKPPERRALVRALRRAARRGSPNDSP